MVDEHDGYDEQPSLKDTNPNAPYYVRTSRCDEQIEDSECTTEVGSIFSQVNSLPTVEQGSSPPDPAQGTPKPTLNGSRQGSINTSPLPDALSRSSCQSNATEEVVPFTPLDIDLSQRSAAAPKKRSRTAPHRSPRPKRPCGPRREAQNRSLRRTCLQGWPVADLDDVNLLDNGSVETIVLWERSTVVEVDLIDEALRERCKELFKKKYGEERWKQWVETDSVRRRRYGRD
jgi:hypothetical protein